MSSPFIIQTQELPLNPQASYIHWSHILLLMIVLGDTTTWREQIATPIQATTGGSPVGWCSVHFSLNRIPGTKTTQSWDLQLDTSHLKCFWVQKFPRLYYWERRQESETTWELRLNISMILLRSRPSRAVYRVGIQRCCIGIKILLA